MNRFTLRGLFLTAVCVMLGCLTVYADDNGPITTQVAVQLDQAGTLSSKIADADKYRITSLKVAGYVNGTDLRLIREMAGRDYEGNATEGKLATLDLSEARIVGGGDSYYQYYDSNNDVMRQESTTDFTIGDYAFYGCTALTSVIMPSVHVTYNIGTQIGKYAFYGCTTLTNVTIPSRIWRIEDHAFEGCTSLTSIDIPADVTSMGMYVFKNSGLTSFSFPSGFTDIPEGIFEDCSNLADVTIPSGLEQIYPYAFHNCSSLTNITIPTGATKIWNNAFKGCTSLTSVSMPSSITSIGERAFENCTSLTSIDIPSGVTSIKDWTFSGCTGLTNVTLPSGLKEILDYAFCFTHLASLNIPSSVNKITINAFSTCYGMKSVYVSWKVPLSISYFTFSTIDKDACTLYVPKGTLQAYQESLWGYNFSNIQEYNVPGSDNKKVSVTTEQAGELPSKIAEADKYKITSLKVAGEVNGTDLRLIREMAGQDYLGRDTEGMLMNLDLSEAKIVEGGDEYYQNTTSSNSVIGAHMFRGCSGLNSVVLPSDITGIGNWAFFSCSGLSSINIPSGTTEIGGYAFFSCRALPSITLPSSITELGSGAFMNCSGLKSVYVSWQDPLSIPFDSFEGIDKNACTLYVPKGKSQAYRQSDWGEAFANIQEYDATGVGGVTTTGDAKEVARYGANGQRLLAPTKGLNIVRYSDGSVKRVLVK